MILYILYYFFLSMKLFNFKNKVVICEKDLFKNSRNKEILFARGNTYYIYNIIDIGLYTEIKYSTLVNYLSNRNTCLKHVRLPTHLLYDCFTKTKKYNYMIRRKKICSLINVEKR